MMIHRLAVVSALAILSAVAFPSKSEAQATQDVNFNGTIAESFTFDIGSVNNPTPSAGFSGNSFEGSADVNISCATSAFISVSAPKRIAAPSAFNDAFRKARVRFGNSSTSTGVGSADGFPLWSDSDSAPLAISSCTGNPLVVEMIAGSTDAGSAPVGSYIYTVTLTATPQ
ncbi:MULTISPECIES: hypothetical protein [unclassified Nostoc]|uniref:hypothetical protein n=1 Tax=unclassified Nostoc TaxID=2593658 RepID=UPI002AD4ABAD|nr:MULTISPECIES: hypothetical protein [unclassified Nostoc]MDZ8125927.1 hypothetical protein [Nostoc sp. CmiVER01]MDZ8225794.1 hypothetical protein [Nostoc sp. ChiVER01]